MQDTEAHFAALKGQTVVVDMAAEYVHVGLLTDYSPAFLILEGADVHDLRDSSTTRELYVIETRRHGIRSNRKRVYVERSQIVSLSALDDVVD